MKLFAKVVISTVLFGSLGNLAQAVTVSITATTPGNVGTVTVNPGITSYVAVGDAGGLSANLYNASTTATPTFFDDFVFTIPTSSSLYSISASLTSTLTGISSFTESLYSGSVAGPTPTYSAIGTNPLLAVNLIGSSASNSLSFSNLAAGTYTLQFSGTLAKAQTTTFLGKTTTIPTVGAYASLISVTAVPEPESYAMLIAGLGLIGAAVKRRKVTQA
jgi:hypothetical protein